MGQSWNHKWGSKPNHHLLALWADGWFRDLRKQTDLGNIAVRCHLTTLLVRWHPTLFLVIHWIFFFFVRFPKGNEMENSEVRFLSNYYINFNNVFIFHITDEYWQRNKILCLLFKGPSSSFTLDGLLNQRHSFSKLLTGGNDHYNDLYFKIWRSLENSTNILCLAITRE